MVAGRHAHPTAILLTFLALLVVHSRAQDFKIDISIANSNRTTAIVPNEVNSINITADGPISMLRIEPAARAASSMCDMNTCIINFVSLNTSEQLTITVLNSDLGFDQTLILAIRENLDVSCAQYNVPLRFAQVEDPYVFTCVPASYVDRLYDIVEVVWRRFRDQATLQAFLEAGSGFNDARVSVGVNFTLSGARNSTLSVTNNPIFEAQDVAYYYVPSFVLSNGSELLTAETLIFVGPMIMGEEEEFSIDIVLKTDEARSFDGIRCEALSFPPATVSWILTSEDYPNGTNLLSLEQFNLTDSGENLTLSTDAIVEMRNLRFEDDGNFTCIVENGLAVSTRYFRLRVKSNLRPLWPFVGIVSVLTLVGLSMCCHAAVDRLIAMKKSRDYRSPVSSPNHTDSDGQRQSSVSSSSGHSNNRGRKHVAVKRLSSNRPLIEESTL